jgi:hypothetical protein
MTPTEIITADAEQRGLDARKVLNAIAGFVQSKMATLIQEDNTLLVLKLIEGNNAELHLFTADAPMTMARALAKIIPVIQRTSLNAVYGKADNDQIIQLLQRLGVDVQESDRPEYNWMAIV